jgi:cyd operon protein YbgT
MWYFTWILGIAFAAAFAILNAMWYELKDDAALARRRAAPGRTDSRKR